MVEAGSVHGGGVLHTLVGSVRPRTELCESGAESRSGGGRWGRVSMGWRQDGVPEGGGTVGGAELGPAEEELRVSGIGTRTGNAECL